MKSKQYFGIRIGLKNTAQLSNKWLGIKARGLMPTKVNARVSTNKVDSLLVEKLYVSLSLSVGRCLDAAVNKVRIRQFGMC
jgi:hypothetical protein